jgi:RNA polymerase sigma-70 factor, ECF subfamily
MATAPIACTHRATYLQKAIIVPNKYSHRDTGHPCIEELYARHRDFIYRVAMRILRNATDAEDVIQNVFLRMMRNGAPPDVGQYATAYLRRAATNAAIDLIRRRTQRAETDLPSHHPAAKQTVVERHHVRQMLDKLPPKNAELFELHYRGGYSYEELAERFGIQVGAVKSRLFRIRAALQKELQAA